MGEKVITDKDNYTSIANAIRYKNGLTTQYKPSEMANAIKALSGSGTANPKLQSKTATPSKSRQEITYDSDYDGLEKVTVESIPSNYIEPSGTKSITSNGNYDVSSYASADVNVSGIDTSDATATANDMAKNKTAYVNGQKITGDLSVISQISTSATPSSNETDISLSYNNSSRRIFDKNATLILKTSLSNFGDATETDVMAGKTFTSINGLKITGTATIGEIDMSDATATKNNIQEGKTAYISTGELVTGTLINTGKGEYLWKKYSGKVYEITKTKIGTTKPSDCSGGKKGSYDITDDGCFELSGTSYLGGYYYIVGQNTDAKSIYRESWTPSTSGGNGTTTYYLWTISGEYTEGKGGFLGYISSTSDSTYPDNGMKDGYYYIKLNVSEVESTEKGTSEGV